MLVLRQKALVSLNLLVSRRIPKNMTQLKVLTDSAQYLLHNLHLKKNNGQLDLRAAHKVNDF